MTSYSLYFLKAVLSKLTDFVATTRYIPTPNRVVVRGKDGLETGQNMKGKLVKPIQIEAMAGRNLYHLSFLHKDLNKWEYPEPILVLLLFFPSKKEAEAMTQLERLGLWAARQAREEAKKNTTKAPTSIDDPQNED